MEYPSGGWEMDLVYLGFVVIFFALTWGLLRLCARLLGERS
jgi:hypothetical protein